MKESTRRAKEQRKHDEALATLLRIPIEEVLAQREKEEKDSKALEVQAIHLFLEKPEAFISKTCDYCHHLFLTSYKFVSLCSSRCRIRSLEEMGIQWNPMHSTTERWARAQIPTEYSIPPEALKVLLQIAEHQQEISEAQLHEEFSVIDSELPSDFQNIEQHSNDVLVFPIPSLLVEEIGPDEDYLL